MADTTPDAAPTEEATPNYALFAVLIGGIYMAVMWFIEPLLNASKTMFTEPPQERGYIDPTAPDKERNMRLFRSLADEPTLTLTVIIPAFNEEHRVGPTIRSTVAYFDERKRQDPNFSYEIIVVDDGSTDRTNEVVMELVNEFTCQRVRLLSLMKNHGKGGAIRKAVLRSSGKRILFMDADNATDIAEFETLNKRINDLKRNKGVLICGSRAHLQEKVAATRNPLRNFLMYGFHVLVRALCTVDIKDTQCGFKLFDRAAALLLFPPLHIERWAFDVELFHIATVQKLTIKEVPVKWTEVPGSKLNVISASISMLRELILIRVCYATKTWKVTDGSYRLRKKQ